MAEALITESINAKRPYGLYEKWNTPVQVDREPDGRSTTARFVSAALYAFVVPATMFGAAAMVPNVHLVDYVATAIPATVALAYSFYKAFTMRDSIPMTREYTDTYKMMTPLDYRVAQSLRSAAWHSQFQYNAYEKQMWQSMPEQHEINIYGWQYSNRPNVQQTNDDFDNSEWPYFLALIATENKTEIRRMLRLESTSNITVQQLITNMVSYKVGNAVLNRIPYKNKIVEFLHNLLATIYKDADTVAKRALKQRNDNIKSMTNGLGVLFGVPSLFAAYNYFTAPNLATTVQTAVSELEITRLNAAITTTQNIASPIWSYCVGLPIPLVQLVALVELCNGFFDTSPMIQLFQILFGTHWNKYEIDRFGKIYKTNSNNAKNEANIANRLLRVMRCMRWTNVNHLRRVARAYKNIFIQADADVLDSVWTEMKAFCLDWPVAYGVLVEYWFTKIPNATKYFFLQKLMQESPAIEYVYYATFLYENTDMAADMHIEPVRQMYVASTNMDINRQIYTHMQQFKKVKMPVKFVTSMLLKCEKLDDPYIRAFTELVQDDVVKAIEEYKTRPILDAAKNLKSYVTNDVMRCASQDDKDNKDLITQRLIQSLDVDFYSAMTHSVPIAKDTKISFMDMLAATTHAKQLLHIDYVQDLSAWSELAARLDPKSLYTSLWVDCKVTFMDNPILEWLVKNNATTILAVVQNSLRFVVQSDIVVYYILNCQVMALDTFLLNTMYPENLNSNAITHAIIQMLYTHCIQTNHGPSIEMLRILHSNKLLDETLYEPMSVASFVSTSTALKAPLKCWDEARTIIGQQTKDALNPKLIVQYLLTTTNTVTSKQRLLQLIHDNAIRDKVQEQIVNQPGSKTNRALWVVGLPVLRMFRAAKYTNDDKKANTWLLPLTGIYNFLQKEWSVVRSTKKTFTDTVKQTPPTYTSVREAFKNRIEDAMMPTVHYNFVCATNVLSINPEPPLAAIFKRGTDYRYTKYTEDTNEVNKFVDHYSKVHQITVIKTYYYATDDQKYNELVSFINQLSDCSFVLFIERSEYDMHEVDITPVYVKNLKTAINKDSHFDIRIMYY